MTTLLNWEVTLSLAFALPVISVTAQSFHTLHNKIDQLFMRRCIARIATMVVSRHDPCDREMQSLRRNFTTTTILDSMIFISDHIHGIATNRLALIVEVCELEHRLIRLISRARKAGALYRTSQLLRLAPSASTIEIAINPLFDANPESRLYATIGKIASYPHQAIRHIVRLNTPLTIYTTAIFTQLLRRAGVPIAYTPMLASENRNLQLIGIYLAESLLAVDAEVYLQRLVASSDYEVAHAGLYALCAIRGDIASHSSHHAVKRLTPPHRAAFLRHAVQSCYSLSSCAQLLTEKERTQFKQRIDSFKSRIVCN